MSSREKITVTCPKCKKESPFVIWRSINTTLNPDMKAAVKDRSAFRFECPSCGEKTYVDYGFLYHQMEDRIMIHYANSDKNAEEVYKMLTEDDPTGMLVNMRKEGYLIRIVRTQNELLEKIAIFDEGLDDRIVEIFRSTSLLLFRRIIPIVETLKSCTLGLRIRTACRFSRMGSPLGWQNYRKSSIRNYPRSMLTRSRS